jgi:phosphoribosylaminoimidazolecarboxamide formyltransferase/IMP cyclohydrolase
MKKAILSVSNKSGIVEFAKALTNLDYELYSTGGTKRVLEDANTLNDVLYLDQLKYHHGLLDVVF